MSSPAMTTNQAYGLCTSAGASLLTPGQRAENAAQELAADLRADAARGAGNHRLDRALARAAPRLAACAGTDPPRALVARPVDLACDLVRGRRLLLGPAL